MMTYVEPADVVSPRAHWKLITVLSPGEENGVAYALGEWDGKPRIGMRWNGTAKRPIGNPQSRGLPTWTMLEPKPDIHLPILQTLPEEKQVLACSLLGMSVPPMIEFQVARHPSGRYTLTLRRSGQRVPEDARDPALFGNMNETSFFRAVYEEVKRHQEAGSRVVLRRLPDDA